MAAYLNQVGRHRRFVSKNTIGTHIAFDRLSGSPHCTQYPLLVTVRRLYATAPFQRIQDIAH